MTNIFSKDFLFYINRVNLETVDYAFVFVAVALVVLGCVFWFLYRSIKKTSKPLALVYRKFAHLGLTMGILGVMWFGARVEYVRWFGTHFSYLVLVLVALVWLARLVWFVVKPYKAQKVAWEKEALKNKYLAK